MFESFIRSVQKILSRIVWNYYYHIICILLLDA